MQNFMDQDFLLTTGTAKTLYHDYASKLPIIDYHCHINPREIAENKQFGNITQVWLGGDHYKWRLMRAYGINEKFITGDGSDYDKFLCWTKTLQRAIGNPVYHWSHLELQRYFGYYGALNDATADEVWELCNEKLSSPEFSARNIMIKSGVETICTTDDPIDTLEWHAQIKADDSFTVKVLPAFRPDKALNIEKPEFIDYISKLSKISEVSITDFSSLCEALQKRIDFFSSIGCSISDHALEYVMFQPASSDEIEGIFQKKVRGETLTEKEILQYKTGFMLFVGRCYKESNWAMQLHYGTKRDNNKGSFQSLGPDTGYDCINNVSFSSQLADYLNALQETDSLPRTIIYSLNPNDNAAIDTVIGCFQDGGIKGKLQHGSAWWFNDHKTGMTDQMTSLANTGLLSTFLGMLTDSRSFLSYPRHEYFRRILCDLIGTWVEKGEYPCDIPLLGEIVQDISYFNTKKYFNF